MNKGDLKDERYVDYDEIIFRVPLNEKDFKTNVYEVLEKYCIENNIIKTV
jgi:hypothetical protein